MRCNPFHVALGQTQNRSRESLRFISRTLEDIKGCVTVYADCFKVDPVNLVPGIILKAVSLYRSHYNTSNTVHISEQNCPAPFNDHSIMHCMRTLYEGSMPYPFTRPHIPNPKYFSYTSTDIKTKSTETPAMW